MKAEKLLDLGWAILKKDGPGPDSGRVVTILTRIPHWDRMTWAERIFHRASYGFNEKGELLLKEKSIEDPETMKAILNGKLRGAEPRTLYAEPGWALPGADERLRKILQRHTNWEKDKHRENAVAWLGPDGSIIYTSEQGWGIPGMVELEPTLHYEFGKRRGLCPWQNDLGQQPGWSASPPDEPTRQTKTPTRRRRSKTERRKKNGTNIRL